MATGAGNQFFTMVRTPIRTLREEMTDKADTNNPVLTGTVQIGAITNVETEINSKADTSYVDAADGVLQSSINDKADTNNPVLTGTVQIGAITNVETEINSKATGVLEANSGLKSTIDSEVKTNGTRSLALGLDAGATNQGNDTIAIGHNAGNSSQGVNSIAIGKSAGQTSQDNNSIILNATGAALNSTGSNRTHIAPIRNVEPVTQVVGYDTTTKEITYGDVLDLPSLTTIGELKFNGGQIGNTGDTSYQILSLWSTGLVNLRYKSRFDILYWNGSSTSIAWRCNGSNGNVTNYGNLTVQGSFYNNSDKRLKSNIQEADYVSAYDGIKSLPSNSFTFHRNDSPKEIDYGIIADNLQEIFPKLVQTLQDETITDAEGNPINNVKQYDVPGLVHVLLAAFKHSQSLIDTLTAKVNLPFLVYNLDKTNETILPQSIIGDQSDSNNGTWVLKSFSTGSDIYTTSGEFVIPSNGVYEVILSLHLSTSVNTNLSVQFNKNGIGIGLASKSMLSNTTDTFTGQITTDFLNGDILTIKQVNAANNAKVTTNPENCCQLHIRQLS